MGKNKDEWDCHSPTVLVQKTRGKSRGMELCFYAKSWIFCWRERCCAGGEGGGSCTASPKCRLLSCLSAPKILTLQPLSLKLRTSEPKSPLEWHASELRGLHAPDDAVSGFGSRVLVLGLAHA
jgi:hypothetical protein